MNPKARRARPGDFEGFYRAAFPRHQDDAALHGIVKHEWNALLKSETSINLIIEDADAKPARIIGCAQAAFIQPALAQRLREGASPWVNAHLAAPLEGHSSPMLSVQELARANSLGTLNGVMARWHLALQEMSGAQALEVRRLLHRNMERFSRGHNFQQIFAETTGVEARKEAISMGFEEVCDYLKYFQEHPPLPPEEERPCLLAATREQAQHARSSLIGYAFAYKPPRFFFTPAEREVLQHALDGADGKALAQRCGLTLDGVNTRWKSIFERVSAIEPAMIPQSQAGKRGEAKRSRLIEYLQDHPEELRPHLPPSST